MKFKLFIALFLFYTVTKFISLSSFAEINSIQKDSANIIGFSINTGVCRINTGGSFILKTLIDYSDGTRRQAIGSNVYNKKKYFFTNLYLKENNILLTQEDMLFSSSDNEVVEIDETGTVKAKKAGIAEITAKCGTRQASTKVIVLDTIILPKISSVVNEKTFSIDFHSIVDKTSITLENIFVIDSSGAWVYVSVESGKDGSTALVKPPYGGYKKAEKYKLYIMKDIKLYSNSGKTLGKSYVMDFDVQ
ncbi:MAG: Ig-like domain-containing protein [Clostridia bacterium]|nr:Ig-like domain-containing protein [Clostridia bacterium]